MRRGSVLLTLGQSVMDNAGSAAALLRKGVLTVAVERIEDRGSNRPIADILHEIDGCASMAIASALLTDPVHGKGILLGGVTGIVPCEVTVLGSGMGAIAAAHNALGLGATVRMFDNDLYSLRQAARVLRHEVIGSALHSHVLESSLRTADVVVATPATMPFALHSEAVGRMKKGVLTFDLTAAADGSSFPSMTPVDLALASAVDGSLRTDNRICYVHAGSAVARTAAMALTNTLLTLLESIVSCEGPSNALKLHPGMQKATLTFFGKPVNPAVASMLRTRSVDISIFLTLS